MDKPGYKTTEFWLTALATLVALFIGSGVLSSEHLAMKIAAFAAAALAQLGYGISRGLAKSSSPLKAVKGETIKTPDWAKK